MLEIVVLVSDNKGTKDQRIEFNRIGGAVTWSENKSTENALRRNCQRESNEGVVTPATICWVNNTLSKRADYGASCHVQWQAHSPPTARGRYSGSRSPQNNLPFLITSLSNSDDHSACTGTPLIARRPYSNMELQPRPRQIG